jgi:hypothetical protein
MLLEPGQLISHENFGHLAFWALFQCVVSFEMWFEA